LDATVDVLRVLHIGHRNGETWSSIVMTPEQRFWVWFIQNDESLFNFERDLDRVFAALTTALSVVAPDLTFEFGSQISGRRDFVISAGGIKSAFAAVEALAAAAPALSRWNVVAFRPRRASIMGVRLSGLTVLPKHVEFCLLSDDAKLGICLFFDGYQEQDRKAWGQIGYLMLDQALGEYDVETKVGRIELFSSHARSGTARYPLSELPEMFDAQFARLPLRH
jgi:hypothetical protein